MDKCIQDDNLIDNYKMIVKNIEKEIKEYQNEISESDKMLSIAIDEKKIIEKEKDKIKNSIEMFFRLNENIIKEF